MLRLIRALLSLVALWAVASPIWAQNFGIGILAPQQKLDVNGRVRIQNLTPAALTPNRVIVADANGVLSEFNFTGQPAGNTIVWNGANFTIGVAGDNWGTQSAAVNGPLTGNGTAGSPLGLTAGTAAGQVLTWNGVNWVSQAVPSSADNWGTQTAAVNGPITGNGTAGSPLGLTAGGAAGQVLTWNGVNWVSQAVPSSADNWGTQTAAVNGPLTGNGTAGSPLGLTAGGAAGQVLTWNGAAWVSQAPASGADNWGTQVAVTNGPITGTGVAGTPITMTNGTAAGQVWQWNGAAWVLTPNTGADNWGTQVAVSAGPLTGTGVAGTPLTFANGTANGQVWQWNGAAWVLATIAGADNWGTQVAVTNGPITGTGVAGTPITMANGTAAGQVWQWNGVAWVLTPNTGADNWGTQVAVSAGPLTGTGVAGTPLTFANGTANGQVWQWNGAAWVLATIAGADNWGTQTAAVNGPITGNGTAGSPLGLIAGGAAGQVLTWNGATWVSQAVPSSADNWGTQVAAVNGPITGNGTAGSPLGLIAGAANGHVLTWNGVSWVSQAPGSGADNWGTQVAVSAGPLTGTGVAGTPLTFSPGTAAGQVWQWDGTNWVLATPTATVITSGPLQGNGTAGNPVTFDPGTLAGQIWQWDGATWILTIPQTSGPMQGTGTAANPFTFDPGTAVGQFWQWNGAAWVLATVPSLVDVADVDGLIGTFNAATGVLDIDVQANNGLNVDATDFVQLGGTLIKNTDVNQNNFNMTFSGVSGNFGIGTAAPAARLHVVDSQGGDGLFTIESGNGNGITVSEADAGTALVVQSAGAGNVATFNGTGGIGFYTAAIAPHFIRYENPGLSADWQWALNNNSNVSDGLARFQQTNAANGGRVLMGVHNYNNSAFEAVGVIGLSLNAAGTGLGVIGVTNANGGTGVEGQWPGVGAGWALFGNGDSGGLSGWFNVSDSKFKKNVNTIPNAIDLIRNLRGVTYEHNTEAFPGAPFRPGTQYGFIAQEVEQVLPTAVRLSNVPIGMTGTADQAVTRTTVEARAVNYSAVIPVLVEALKQQQTQIEQQQQQINQLMQLLQQNGNH